MQHDAWEEELVHCNTMFSSSALPPPAAGTESTAAVATIEAKVPIHDDDEEKKQIVPQGWNVSFDRVVVERWNGSSKSLSLLSSLKQDQKVTFVRMTQQQQQQQREQSSPQRSKNTKEQLDVVVVESQSLSRQQNDNNDNNIAKWVPSEWFLSLSSSLLWWSRTTTISTISSTIKEKSDQHDNTKRNQVEPKSS